MTETTALPTTAPLGDPLPGVLAAYYVAIDTSQFEDAAATFAPRCRYAVPLPGTVETGPRDETVGPADLLDRFLARGPKPWRHVARLCVNDGPDTLVEGVLVDDTGEATSTFVASARIDEVGLIERYLAYACAGARAPIPTDVEPTTVPGGGTGSFISSLSLAADGTIRRYVSFYCEPGVPA